MNRFVILLLLVSSPLWAQNYQVTGKARSVDGETLYYTETYQFERNEAGDVVAGEVSYQTPDGEEFATKTIKATKFTGQPDILFTDLRAKETTEVNSDGQELRLNRRVEGKKTKQKTLSFPRKTQVVVDAGFDEFVRQHWQALLDGKTVKMAFFPIDRSSLVDFNVKMIKKSDQQVSLEMSPDSFWVGMVIDPILLDYDTKQRLISYRGITNIAKYSDGEPDGENYTAHITYQYADN